MSEEKVVLGGRYVLGEVLGTGGMAEVFLAEDTRLHRTVAVKVLRSDLARDANFQERFRREAHSAASLNHPSIVAVYDTGEEHQTAVTGADLTIPYIVMEYVHGTTLRDHISPEQPMDAHRAGEIMAALLSALEYSHRAGIVHRDIKPGNVMINDAGAVKVMDFGIARAVADATSSMTATQAVMGTAQYLSPEQARGQLVDARSDIYSAACVMYELLTGRPPFTGDTPVSIAYQHVREEPQPPSNVNPAITPAMDAVILTGLAKDREQRYASAVAFSRDIALVIAGRSPLLAGDQVAAASAGSADESTTVLSPVDDATEALPALAGAAATRALPAGAPRSAPSPATGPLSIASPEPEVEEPPRKRPWWLIILVIIAVLALVGTALAFFLPREPAAPEMVPVPGVVGQSEDQAREALDAVGLVPDFTQDASTEVEAGDVISTDPPEGEQVEVGSTVTVTVSAGPDAVEVPDVTGKSQEEAEDALEEVGLVGNVTEEVDEPAESGTVLRSSPRAGSRAEHGSTVELTVASGQVSIPNVVGTGIDAATTTLEDRGFDVNPTERADEDANPGEVLEQSPKESDGTAAFGSTINVVVATEPGPATVPNVEGRELADAEKALSDEGFGTRNDSEYSDSVPEGRVIRTEPGANESVDRGSTILIVVSAGPEPTQPPTDEPTEDPTDEPTDEPTDDPTDEESPPEDPPEDEDGNG